MNTIKDIDYSNINSFEYLKIQLKKIADKIVENDYSPMIKNSGNNSNLHQYS